MAVALAPQMFAGTWLKSVAAAQKVAKEKNQLILVDMYAEWCGWCHKFEKDVYPSSVFQDATKDIVLLRLDTEDGKEGTQMARKFAVTSLPTFLLLTPDLSAAGMIRGYAPANDFVLRLKDARTQHQMFLQRVKNAPKIAKDYIQRLELAKDFAARSAYDKSEPRFRKLMAEKGVPAAVRDNAYYELAVSYFVQRKYDDALKTIRSLTAISRLGEAVERSRVLMGQIYLQQGNLAAAANEFRSFKQTFPDSPLNRNIDMVLPEIEKRLASGK
jgi:thioredoxin-related protein